MAPPYSDEERKISLSSKGKKIDESKYNSMISERQRFYRRTRTEIFHCDYESWEMYKGAEKLINLIYHVNLNFDVTLDELNNEFRVQKKAKRNYQITNFIKLKKALRVTIFNEGQDALFWTTYIFGRTALKKSLKFTYRESQKRNQVQERLSPTGMASTYLFRYEFKKRFERFVAPKVEQIFKKFPKQNNR